MNKWYKIYWNCWKIWWLHYVIKMLLFISYRKSKIVSIFCFFLYFYRKMVENMMIFKFHNEKWSKNALFIFQIKNKKYPGNVSYFYIKISTNKMISCICNEQCFQICFYVYCLSVRSPCLGSWDARAEDDILFSNPGTSFEPGSSRNRVPTHVLFFSLGVTCPSCSSTYVRVNGLKATDFL